MSETPSRISRDPKIKGIKILMGMQTSKPPGSRSTQGLQNTNTDHSSGAMAIPKLHDAPCTEAV